MVRLTTSQLRLNGVLTRVSLNRLLELAGLRGDVGAAGGVVGQLVDVTLVGDIDDRGAVGLDLRLLDGVGGKALVLLGLRSRHDAYGSLQSLGVVQLDRSIESGQVVVDCVLSHLARDDNRHHDGIGIVLAREAQVQGIAVDCALVDSIDALNGEPVEVKLVSTRESTFALVPGQGHRGHVANHAVGVDYLDGNRLLGDLGNLDVLEP